MQAFVALLTVALVPVQDGPTPLDEFLSARKFRLRLRANSESAVLQTALDSGKTGTSVAIEDHKLSVQYRLISV